MIEESYGDIPFGQKAIRTSKNLLALRTFTNRSNLFNTFHSNTRSFFSPQLRTLQLVLAHFQLDLALSPPVFEFPHAQKAVYSHPHDNPIFKGRKLDRVNIVFLTHTLNFFKYHLTTREAQTLFDTFSGLRLQKQPRSWNTQIRQGLQNLGGRWYGTWGMCRSLIFEYFCR